METSLNHTIVSVVGTRPELQRAIPVLSELRRRVKNPMILYIPQKKDPDAIEMLEKSGIMHSILPNLFKNRKPGSIDALIQGVQKKLTAVGARTVMVSGDTTVAVSACLAARQDGVAVAKIGAGLRLGDFNAPEEKNDILTDHLATTLFCFSEAAKQNLLNEGVPEKRITVSGSTLIWHIHETLRAQHFRRDEKGVVLVSIHRKENLESKSLMPVLYRTLVQKKITATCIIHQESTGPKAPRSRYLTMHTTSVSYPAFISKLVLAKYVITDSNTLAEEACFLGVPCITIATHTNRPETVAIGANVLVNPNLDKKTFREQLETAIYRASRSKRNWKFPYGDVRMTTLIANCIADGIVK